MSVFERLERLLPDLRREASRVELENLPSALLLRPLAEIGYFQFCAEAEAGARRRALDLLSSGCGTTAFLASQHAGVCRRLAEAGHSMAGPAAQGEVWCGVCFAHLRRTPAPVDCLEFRDHLVYSGIGPWFTGYPFMNYVLIGGATQAGAFHLALAEMSRSEIAVEPLPRLACMNGTGTVSLFLNALPVDRGDLVVSTDRAGLHQKDMHSTVYQGARSLGIARAAGRFLPEQPARRVLKKIDLMHRKMEEWDLNPTWPEATELRLECIRLASRTIEGAFITEGGKAQLAQHTLSRLLREHAFYTTTQLTNDLRIRVLDEV